MKKIKLFLAAVAAMVTMGVNAQTWTGNAVAEGTFYLYNVGAEKFLNVGDPTQDWGTNAWLSEISAFDVDLASVDDGKYTIETKIKNNDSDHYLNSSTWCDGSATQWQFRAVDGETNIYQIIYDGQYLMATEGLDDVVLLGDPAGRTTSTYWKLVTKADRIAALANATPSTPMDATFLIQDPNFGRNDQRISAWTQTKSGGENKLVLGGNRANQCFESYHTNNFEVSQVLSSIPAGKYGLKAQGFYRADSGDSGKRPYFFIGTATVNIPLKTGSENTHTAASDAFTAGNYFSNEAVITLNSSGDVTIGAKLEENGWLWTTFDNFILTYYGDPVTVKKAEFEEVVAAAEAVEGTVPTAAYNALAAVVTEQNQTYSTIAEYDAAISAINTAVSTYASAEIIANYSRYQTIKTAALALDDDATVFTGEATINTTTADTEVEAATTVAGIKLAIVTLRAAASSFLGSVTVNDGKAFDITNVFITNPAPWATTEGWACPVAASVNSSAQAAEFWNKREVSITQELESLPAGYYTLKAQAFARTGCAPIYIFAGAADTDSSDDNIQELIKKSNSEISTMDGAGAWFDAGNGWNTFTYQNETAGSFTIGLKDEFTPNGSHGDGNDGWLIWRQFGLEYLGTEPVSVLAGLYDDALDAAEAARDNATYTNVQGNERAALLAAIADTPSATVASYKEKTSALIAATNGFIDDGVLIAYNAYATSYSTGTVHTAKTEADYISTSIYTGLALAAPATASEASTKATTDAQAIRIATAEYVAENYAYSLTSKIGDFSTWDGTATYTDGEGTHEDTPQTNSNQHWSATTRDYYEQGSHGWAASNGFSSTYTKVTTLPAGNYVIKVAARASGAVNGTISSTATGNTVSLPNAGSSTKGIDTSGAANFGPGTFANSNNGYGWEWRFLPFTVATDDTEVTITIQESTTAQYNWFSLADAELLSDEDKTTKVTLDDASDMATTISGNDGELATVTLKRTIKVGYNTVVLPFDLTAVQVQALFGASSVVYDYSENSAKTNSVELTFTTRGAGTITANVPVLVRATTASTQNVIEGVTIAAPAAAAAAEGTNFDYVGVYENTTFEDGDYFLATQDGVQKVFESNGTDTAKPFRAYFQKKTPAPVKAFLYIDGVATSISEINGDNNNVATETFNLAGQRVNKAQKGIYIVNGKKVLVK